MVRDPPSLERRSPATSRITPGTRELSPHQSPLLGCCLGGCSTRSPRPGTSLQSVGPPSVTLSVARAPLAGSAATTSSSELTEGMVYAVLQGGADQGSPPTVGSSDAGAPGHEAPLIMSHPPWPPPPPPPPPPPRPPRESTPTSSPCDS
mmetsp:Transcript_32558/g.95790  ORF Transcript_32558/g.95790 Transcript_32558/m.95790 type:complete len:149 (+) Transcript_32558:90-536(+)|eukprot:2310944-Prymnesium_polylepis.1